MRTSRPAARLRALPPWLPLAIGVAITSPLAVYWWNLIAAGSITFDWDVYGEAGRRAWAGSADLYDPVLGFKHSPLFAYLVGALSWIGSLGIRLVTLAAAVAMPTWPMRLLAIASWPFAMDLQHGALFTIIVCVAAWALRGSRVAEIAFVVIASLSPRVLMVPILAYLLWKRPPLRMPAIVIALASSLAVLATGYADEWAASLVALGTEQIGSFLNLSPSRFIGAWWLVIGVPLAIWLTLLRRPGFAALAASPYVLPHYLLFLLLELPNRVTVGGERDRPARVSSR